MDNIELREKLRSYQREALDMMENKKGILLYDDMGLGKCLTSLADLSRKLSGDNFDIIIVCGKKSLYVWGSSEENIGEVEKWLGMKSIIYHGTPHKREKAWREYVSGKSNHFLVTTYGMVEELMHRKEVAWDGLICDEIHENGLLNHKNITYKLIDKFSRNIPFLWLLTGTPIRKGMVDLYGPLRLVDRKRFTSYWGYVNKYGIILATPFGKEIERRPRNPEEFREMLKAYMVRRTKQELRERGDLKDLPDKQRQPIVIEMSEMQERVYNELLMDMFSIDGDRVIIASNKMSVILRQRQLLVCPRILGIADDGTALETIIASGKELIDNQQSFVIFTPFKEAFPFIRKKAEKEIKGIKIYEVHGDMSAKDFAVQWQTFQNSKTFNKMLICTIASASSFNAYTSSHCFFLGYEWDFNLNAQAEDRLCRYGQASFVNCYYPMYRGTVDMDIKQRLNDKQEASNWIVGTEEQYQLLLKRYKANFGKTI